MAISNQQSEINNQQCRPYLSVTDVTTTLSPVIRAGLGVNQDAEQFGSVLLETDLQLGLNVVHPRERKIVRQRAMTGDVHAAADALDDELVNVEDFRKLRGSGFQAMLEFGVADHFFRLFNGGRFALDVGEDVGDF